MDAGEAATLMSVLLVMGMMIPAAREQLRKDPAGFYKTLKIAGLYLLFVVAGIGLAFFLFSGPQPSAWVAVGAVFILAWILYGVLWLTKLVPRYRKLPAWFDRPFGALDYAFWAIVAVCLLAKLVSLL